jgi:hypothetical protein
MLDNESSAIGFGYEKTDLEIPQNLQVPSDEKIENMSAYSEHGNQPEVGQEIMTFLKKPHQIANKIRAIKHQLADNPQGGAEFRQELLEEYEKLKQLRDEAKEELIEIAGDSKANIDKTIEKHFEHMKKAEMTYEKALKENDKNEANRALEIWWEYRDCCALLLQDFSNITLENEDDGLSLEGLLSVKNKE